MRGMRETKRPKRIGPGDGGHSPEDKSLGSGRGLAVPSPDVYQGPLTSSCDS
jgi:hypothetical protein